MGTVKALVTGGAGFIGSSIGRELVRQGWSVRVLDNLLTGSEERIPPEAEWVRGDLRDTETVRRACTGVEVIFHEGALRSVARSVDNPLLSQECNVLGTLNVLMAAEEARVRRVIYASSSSVYGDGNGQVNREDMSPDPLSPYAASKLAAEYYCRVWTRLKGLSTVSLRYFNVFGPGQDVESKYAAVFPAFISSLAANSPPEVHWDGEQSRDFTYIDDVVKANILAAEADSRVDGSIINIGGGRPQTVNHVLSSVSEVMDRWIEPVLAPKRAGDVRHTRADISRAAELLSWSPTTPWKQAIHSTVRWFMRGPTG
jgi:nucleoside-diphosphate-sugar epimerase